jgi:hypothetical protein
VTVFEGCTVDMLSADGKLILHVDRRGGLAVRQTDGARLAIAPATVPLRASFLWSPAAQMFAETHFTGDNNLAMRVFRREGSRMLADVEFENVAKNLYDRRGPCGRGQGLSDVWMLGWSPDGRTVDVAARAADKASCKSHPVATRLDVHDHAVRHVYSDEEIDKKYPREFWIASVVGKSGKGH